MDLKAWDTLIHALETQEPADFEKIVLGGTRKLVQPLATLAVNLSGLLNAVVTVTDGDGDVDTDTVAIGGSIVFEDDGPNATIALNSGTTVTLDESVGDRFINPAGTADPA